MLGIDVTISGFAVGSIGVLRMVRSGEYTMLTIQKSRDEEIKPLLCLCLTPNDLMELGSLLLDLGMAWMSVDDVIQSVGDAIQSEKDDEVAVPFYA